MPYETIEQPILPYFRHKHSLLKNKDKILLFLELNAIISSVIPTIMERQKQNNKVMPDHQDILGELGNSEKLLQICTGID